MRLTTQGRIETCVLLCVRTPADHVRHLLPPGLTLATHGRWAFWNVAYGQLSGVRPVGVPRAAGMSYQQVAYRLVVQATNAQGRQRRGVYFVRSFADSGPARWLGNRVTDFNIAHAAIASERRENMFALTAEAADEAGRLQLRLVEGDGQLPAGSCFAREAEADAWLRCESLGLNVRGGKLRLVKVEREREAWRPKPMQVESASFGLFDAMGLGETAVERAMIAGPIDYRWRLGLTEPLASGVVCLAQPVA